MIAWLIALSSRHSPAWRRRAADRHRHHPSPLLAGHRGERLPDHRDPKRWILLQERRSDLEIL